MICEAPAAAGGLKDPMLPSTFDRIESLGTGKVLTDEEGEMG